LDKYEIELQQPDRFINDLIKANSSAVLASAEACCQRLKQPPTSAEEYLEILLKKRLLTSINMLFQFGYC